MAKGDSRCKEASQETNAIEMNRGMVLGGF